VKDLPLWSGIELPPGNYLDIGQQNRLKERVVEALQNQSFLRIDEVRPKLAQTSVDFVTVGLTRVLVNSEPKSEPLSRAVIGVTLIYQASPPPEQLNLAWGNSIESLGSVPVTVTSPAGSRRRVLTSENPQLNWVNELASFKAPQIKAIPVAKPQWPLLSFGLGGLAALVYLPWRRSPGKQVSKRAAIVLMILMILLYPYARIAAEPPIVGGWRPSNDRAAEILELLLTNVSRSFAYRSEEAVYDQLSVSVTGDQLTRIYLENRRGLELENRGGARARVDDVEVQDVISVKADDGGGFVIRCLWKVGGSVNHFGHTHYRQNHYDAEIRILSVEGVWKIKDLDLIHEKRVL
jgi:hypothetical protein